VVLDGNVRTEIYLVYTVYFPYTFSKIVDFGGWTTVVRIILNTKGLDYFKHCPERSVRIFLINKSPHLFKHGPHFF